MKTVTIYTDGACSGNPGPGGWGAILRYKDTVRQLSPANPSRLSRTPPASTPTEAKIILFSTLGCRFGALKGYFTAQNWII